jgi:hypothetical protein
MVKSIVPQPEQLDVVADQPPKQPLPPIAIVLKVGFLYFVAVAALRQVSE